MSGLAVQVRNITPIGVPTTPNESDFCACDFYCEWEEPVFGDSGSDDYKKDYSSFLTRKLTAGDTVTIKLFRYGVEVATITDNSLGTYYASFAAQPLYVGWVADWSLILAVYGGGQYYVQIESVLAGVTTTFTSRKFRLSQYYPALAHRTVKIETYQTGNILSSEFDFNGLLPNGWPNFWRLKGYFGNKTPQLEVDEYLNTAYESVQNRTQVRFTYSLYLDNLPQSIFNLFAERDVLGNRIFITDYDQLQTAIYRRIPVVAESFDTVEPNAVGRGRYELTFAERVQNNIKRNF